MRYHLTGFMLLALLIGAALPSHSQNCTVLERQMEILFTSWQPGAITPLRQVEELHQACQAPSDKMELVYYFFQAADAQQRISRYGNESYRRAAQAYYDASRYFDWLVRAPEPESLFVSIYFARAQSLEAGIENERRRLNLPVYRPDTRASGTTAGWNKPGPPRPTPGSELGDSRSQDAGRVRVETFSKTGPARHPLEPCRCPQPDSFGVVGRIDSLTIFAYIHSLRKNTPTPTPGYAPAAAMATRSAERGVVIPTYETPDDGMPDTWIDALTPDGMAYMPMLSAYDPAIVRLTPGMTGTEVVRVRFGELVARYADEKAISAGGRNWIKVRTQGGYTGWVEQQALVEDGAMAVITRQVPGYAQPASQERQAMWFMPGEAIILERASGDYVRVITRNGTKRGWVRGIEALSIDETDIKIGQRLQEALVTPSLPLRKSNLERLRFLPGYDQSELKPAIESIIQQQVAAR
ncbi:MAG: SH3 domain-containing protein [Bacteroidia bacterium]|nr:SH3 domain-containing protein [Bacteroidia bacterium]